MRGCEARSAIPPDPASCVVRRPAPVEPVIDSDELRSLVDNRSCRHLVRTTCYIVRQRDSKLGLYNVAVVQIRIATRFIALT